MTRAAQARQAACLSIEEAARRVRISVAYLRQLERKGRAPYATALRLAKAYNCDPMLFLYSENAENQNTKQCPIRRQPFGQGRKAIG